jgi:hypothetical protein
LIFDWDLDLLTLVHVFKSPLMPSSLSGFEMVTVIGGELQPVLSVPVHGQLQLSSTVATRLTPALATLVSFSHFGFATLLNTFLTV